VLKVKAVDLFFSVIHQCAFSLVPDGGRFLGAA
jgi:hypothetical protein